MGPARPGSSLARGAATITLATGISRVTGFVRVMAVAAAMGTTFLANTYQTANSIPNVVFELVAAGVLTSVFVPTFVEHLVKGTREQGWRTANVLGSVALAALVGLALLVALAAPLIMRILTLGVEDPELRAQQIALGSTFLRLFSPQVIFYGVGMIMTSALHAHGRFGLAASAPIFNNLVVIVVYLTYAAMRGPSPPTVSGISTAETLVLGLGTTSGVIAMTLSLLPGLRRLGWRARWLFEPRHEVVRKAARLGVWALGYAGGYQAGLVLVLFLANRQEGGVAAYQWAYTFFYVPHALFGMPLFHVLFPAMSEDVAKGETAGFERRLRDGLAMLAFVLVPVSMALIVTAEPIARLTLEYGVMSRTGAQLIARVLAAFALGLPTYSAFLALTRAFYARGDTKTPAMINAAAVSFSGAAGAALFFVAPERWAVPGLAAGHSIGFAFGAVMLAVTLARHGAARFPGLLPVLARTALVAALAALVMVLVHRVLPDASRGAALINVTSTLAAGTVAYLAVTARTRSQELSRLRSLLLRART